MKETRKLTTPSLSPKGLHGRIEYKWIVLSVTTIGSMMAAIDSIIVILALPDMLQELHADLVEMIWVIMGYILVSTVFLMTFGRVADLLGRVRMYNLGFVVFTAGSLLCGLSLSAPALIASRLVQGAGAAMMLVNSIALITEVFPANERGRALGINSVTWAAGGVLGPVLGGLILDAGSWRWISRATARMRLSVSPPDTYRISRPSGDHTGPTPPSGPDTVCLGPGPGNGRTCTS